MNESTRTLERNQTNQSAPRKPNFRGRLIFQMLRKRWRGLFIAFLSAWLLFGAIAMIQHGFVHRQLSSTTMQELGGWAEEVTKEIGFKDKWDLEGYRRAAIWVPSWYNSSNLARA